MKKFDPEKPDEILEFAKTAATILYKLRHYTTQWNIHYGATYSGLKKKWEARADEFLAQYDIHIPNPEPDVPTESSGNGSN